jgi:hypothetical protein
MKNIISYDTFIVEKKGPCWVGYKQIGLKNKRGKMVPNCVKESIRFPEKIETFKRI